MPDHQRSHAGDEINNPRTGQRMVFRTTAADSAGRELIIECWSPPEQPGGPREPMHTHPHQDKRFEIIEGELTVLIDGAQRVLRPGDEITVGPQQAHCFWNAGPAEVHYWQEFRPALRTAEFFVTLFALARDGKLDASGKPSLLQFAVTGARFQKEIAVTNPPPWAQRLVTAILAPIARVFGYKPEHA